VDFRNIDDPQQLVILAADLIMLSEAYNKASLVVCQDSPVFKINGYSVADWLHDFKLRVKEIKEMES